jgi:2'-5' RNA ligase
MIDPRSNEMHGYHLFLMPEGELRETLQARIDMLAEKYNGPKFPAHVTLLARIEGKDEAEVLKAAEELAMRQSPFSLTLGSWGRGSEFFKALYVRIEDSDPIEAMHTKVNELLGMTDEDYYSPHLSLYYGLPGDEQRRSMILDMTYPNGATFTVNKVHVYKTEGTADTWEEIGVFRFGGA